ncbi:hypothetical protein BD560DRAFT_336845 [Blakeslea trispora]|nr:hypothetical protein BD560DRAFT_336845 [Blakeslea trispora]
MNIASTSASPNVPTHHIYYHPYHSKRVCQICRNRYLPSTVRDIGPYLIHQRHPGLHPICPCHYSAHAICVKEYGTDFICQHCNYIYHVSHIHTAQFLCFICHMLSLVSVIVLIVGLAHLGKALDELALGKEIGPKLDGDEKWQDHELDEIVDWLNMVHYATGIAGEAMLGLVYLIGVSLVIGLKRTLLMVWQILHLNLEWLGKTRMGKSVLYIALCCLGLLMGSYLLFFSWIWASLLHYVKKKAMNIKKANTDD